MLHRRTLENSMGLKRRGTKGLESARSRCPRRRKRRVFHPKCTWCSKTANVTIMPAEEGSESQVMLGVE